MKLSLSKREINRQRWRERIDAWKTGNQPQKAFCEAHHLGLASFQRWHRIFKAEEAKGVTAYPAPVSFLPVRVRETVMKRTARKKLQQAKRRMKLWVRATRHLPGRAFLKALIRKLVDHYNYFGIRSNGDSVNSFFHYAIGCAFKWLNRRGGKRRSFTWVSFKVALKKLGVALPRIVERERQHATFV